MIHISGYRLVRPLGGGALATVYLAVDIAADREVALKVMSATLLADDDFSARFLREARIAARLEHPGLVRIHDVGHIGKHHYLSMEYLTGGTLRAADNASRPHAFALRVVREIAGALAYLHERGFIHRDVKTNNVLLRGDGAAVLTDFGIVRTNPAAAQMTLTGNDVGTPQYLSPEQARGEVIDGRADLYALGIVLHELLTGRVPYDAEDSVTVGLRHIDDPLPRLSDKLSRLQPLLDHLLAKQPAERFQTGDEVVAAVAELEQALVSSASSGDSLVSAAIPDEPNFDLDRAGIQQPTLGRLDELDEATLLDRAPPKLREPKRARSRGVSGGVLVGIVLMLIVAAWFNQDRLRSLLPETELNRLLDQGQIALNEGRISGTQDAALESFRRARDLEQDNEVARNGLAAVAARLLQQGHDALAHNDLSAARQALTMLRDLRGGGADIDQLVRDITTAETGRDDEAQVLEAAEVALADGRITGSDGAIAAYRKLERNEHAATIAKAGLLKAGKVLEADADAALSAGDLATMASRIDDLAGNLPEYPELADLRGRLSAARQQLKLQNTQMLETAQQRLRAGEVSDGEDSALALYRQVLEHDPSNRTAQEGLKRVAKALMLRADAALEDRDVDRASDLLVQIAKLTPSAPELGHAQARLRDLRESRDIDAQRPTLQAVDIERVRQLLVLGRAAARRGALMDPPQSSAYDYYRAALAIDPGNAAARDGLRELPERARQRYRDSYADGDLSAALAELEVMRQLAPDDPALATNSAELMQACLALAAIRIGERRRADAQHALDLARRIDPGNPGLADLEREAAMLRRE